MAHKNLDLVDLLPKQYRNRTLSTLIRALFNNHLSKDESVILYGYVGSEADAASTDIYVREADLERQVNQLSPVLYSKHGTEERLFTWRELIQRLASLGVPYDSIGEWLNIEAVNFVPFIDLDKFCNFDQYVWVGKWVLEHPELDWADIGIPAAEAVAALNAFNVDNVTDYYVIKRGALDLSGAPTAMYPGLTTWSDWALGNLWVHKDDAFAFQTANPILNTNLLAQALRPILEYENDLKLNLHVTAGAPTDGGTLVGQPKTAPNQLPLFDLYYHDGSHTSYISAGFFYAEAADQPIDEALGRRIVRDSAADLVFSHSFISPSEDRPLFLKRYTGSSFEVISPWRGPKDLTQDFVKYELSGTLVNADKLQNFESYYWSATADGPLPSYNLLADPEYVVIESGGSSGWSLDNRWKHVSALTTAERFSYQQAQRPIIEFNKLLEPELLEAKTALAQLPLFKLWAKDSAGAYVDLSVFSSRLTDAYTYSTLFARIDDLPVTGQGILTASEQSALTLNVRGTQFAQSLITGYYDYDLEGVTYAYSLREFERSGAGDGALAANSLDIDAVPQVIQLTGWSDGVTFNVFSTVFGALPTATVDVPYSVGGLTFTIVSGTTAYDETSVFKFDVKSSVFKKLNLYVRMDGAFKTVSKTDGYLYAGTLDSRQVSVDPLTATGAWKCPTAFFGNLDSVMAETIRQGDLYSHFLTIIEAQADLTGTAGGRNNWRQLSHDFSLGGLIKLYNGRLPLLLGLLSQDSADPISLLEFGQEAYTAVLNRAREFVELELINRIDSNTASFLSAPGDVSDETYRQLRSFLERQSAVVSASETAVDDQVNQPFASSSMPLKALTLTAPYLGLGPKVAPRVALDPEQNTVMLVHHDGHSSALPMVDFEVLKRLVTKRFRRSTGQETPGFIGGPVPPQSPFARMLWLDLSGERLYVYDVVSDTGELPAVALNGQFSYKRSTGETWQYNGSWVSLGSDQSAQEAPWRLLDLSSTLTSLLLRLETELYDGCPSVPYAVDIPTLKTSVRWSSLMQKEFESFCSAYGIINPYECAYDPTNAFSWNYSSLGPATWQETYRTVYGTSRPDLFPWISCGYSDEATFIASLVLASALPFGTTAWDSSFWALPAVVTFIRGSLAGQSRPTTTAVDLTSGQLLPPYGNGHAEQLYAVRPTGPNLNFTYGDLGPIELMWTRTLPYVTSNLKTYFRLDPLSFVGSTWGDETVYAGDYELVRPIGRKAHIADTLVHGEPINRTTLSSSSASFTCTLAPFATTVFMVEVVSAKHQLLKVTEGDSLTPVFCSPSSIPLGSYGSGSLVVPRDGLNLGDRVKVTVSDVGVVTVELIEAAFKFEGLSQLYAHFHVYRSFDVSYSADRTRLLGWTPKLGYRFNTLVDTDVLKVRTNETVVDESGYNVYLKETELQTASWITGLRISLLRRGSTEKVNGRFVPAKSGAGQRGDDWVYRVDLTNAKHPKLEWYEYDAGQYETFFALGSKNSQDEWRRYTGRTSLRRLNGPFVVKGLQALATFIFGYADRAAELGFVFNDERDPVTDSSGRLIGWQLLVEQLIDSQFKDPAEGGVFEAVPFRNRLWFKADYGYVSDLSKPGSSSIVPGLYTLGSVRAPKGSFRVFRDGPTMSVTSDVPLVGAMVATSVFEHVLVLEDKVADITIKNAFLNQHVDRLFLEGFKQQSPTGRPVYGGKYLVGSKMRTNMEGSVQQLSSLYDVSALKSEALFDRASALVSFDRKDYHETLGTTLPTQLQFWRGMLKSKGTNRAISSFINSSLYRSALIDELWAYKTAEYGDLRRALKVELNVKVDDMVGERANYLFLESDELAYIKDLYTVGGYDMTIYDELAYDMFTLYTDEQIVNMDIVDPRGSILIKPDDEVRWNSFTDLGSIAYMKAMIRGIQLIIPGGGGYDMAPYDDVPYDDGGPLIFTIFDRAGNPVLADCFEIVDIDATSNPNVYLTPVLDITSYMKSGSKVYRESGDYIVGTVDPAEFTPPKFRRINASQIEILDSSLLGKRLLVVAYGPPLQRFSPSQLYRDDGGRDTPINSNVIWWDPARGVHSPAAHASIDYETDRDPARYNITSLRYKAKTADGARTWGPSQVGKFWWNTSNAGWMNYYDSKLYADHNQRLQQWGAIADWASIDVCEWVESDQPPASYSGTGEPAVRNYLTRSRTWWHRPVLWLYSTNPQETDKAPLKRQPVTLELLDDETIVAVDGLMPTFDTLERIAYVKYLTADRIDVVTPIGTLEVVDGTIENIVGSASSLTTPTYVTPESFESFSITVNAGFPAEEVGALRFDYEQETVASVLTTYARVTLPSGVTQRVATPDTPIKAGTLIELVFDNLGVKISAVNKYTRTEAWGTLGVLTAVQRQAQVGIEFTAAHDVYVRQQTAIKTLIDPGVTTLPGPSATGVYGWASWVVPNRQLTEDDLDDKFGNWEAVVGEYSAVGTSLNDLKDKISEELSSPQPTVQYEERWTPWTLIEKRVNEGTYYPTVNLSHDQILESLGFDSVTEKEAESAVLYVNGVRVTRRYTIELGASGYYVRVQAAGLVPGSSLRVELPFRVPTADELKTTLEGTTSDPTKLVEYKLDTPYVKLEERNEHGRVAKTRYFYWVKDKETPGVGKKLPVKLAAQQLKIHAGPYAVPQIVKRFNQLDGRPNRYAMLCVVDMTRFVRKDNVYKLRITENGSMRDDDQDITLRTTHSEWKLVRKNQPTRIPKELWDKLVDTCCGETATGQALPFIAYSAYDERNGTTSRIGLKQGQVLSDSSQAIATVKGTLLDTQVVTFDALTDSFAPSPVEFAGYDSTALDTYLATPTSTREFMANLWNNADPRNINELFFAVLEDALSASYELAGIMKTSFVALDEVRTVVVEG